MEYHGQRPEEAERTARELIVLIGVWLAVYCTAAGCLLAVAVFLFRILRTP